MIVLNRYKFSEDNLTHQVHGVINVYENGEVVYRCSTLERKWFPMKSTWSCLSPGPEEPKMFYKLRKSNTYGNTPFQHLTLAAGSKKWSIQPTKESPIYIGQKLVYCEATGLYEFTDFRETILELAKYVDADTNIEIRWTDETNIVGSGYKTKSYFYEDHSLPTYPVLE